MAHEIFWIKLCQLDDRVGKLHSRVHMSETAGHRQLRREINALTAECEASESALRDNLLGSKSGLAAILAQDYGRIEGIIRETKAKVQDMTDQNPDGQAGAEEKILLAEYALDFAQQAADRALLLSMEAIDAQLLQREEGRTP